MFIRSILIIRFIFFLLSAVMASGDLKTKNEKKYHKSVGKEKCCLEVINFLEEIKPFFHYVGIFFSVPFTLLSIIEYISDPLCCRSCIFNSNISALGYFLSMFFVSYLLAFLGAIFFVIFIWNFNHFFFTYCKILIPCDILVPCFFPIDMSILCIFSSIVYTTTQTIVKDKFLLDFFKMVNSGYLKNCNPVI